MTFRDDEWALRLDGRYDSCDSVCLGMGGLLVSSPVTRVHVPWLMKTPREVIYGN